MAPSSEGALSAEWGAKCREGMRSSARSAASHKVVMCDKNRRLRRTETTRLGISLPAMAGEALRTAPGRADSRDRSRDLSQLDPCNIRGRDCWQTLCNGAHPF